MLCSIPTSGKSTSNWLARLRSSKGFPSGTDDLDLGQFLTHNHQDADSIPTKSIPPQPETGNQTETPEMPNASQGKHLMFNIMSNVLAELFIIGGDSNGLPKSHPQKCSRKQPNPRFCGPLNSPGFSCTGNETNNNNNNDATSNDDPHAKRESASPVSDDYSGVGLVKELRGDDRVKLVENASSAEEEDEDEKDKSCWKLSGFSRTEVTVIDTSFARWKFEKMLFRKKNVWKVRDKKGKMPNFTKKKRKSTNVDDENVSRGDVKKARVLDGQCVLSGKGSGAASKQEYQHSNGSQTTCTMTSDNFGNAVKKKPSSSNLEKGSSSVILIKSIPASRKVGTSIPKSCAKSTQSK